MNMAKPQETPAEHLLRSLLITSSARFHASRRLRLHQTVSLWAVSVFSLVLIVVPLFEPFGVAVSLRTSIVNLVNVIAATAILVISILVNASNFAERAEKMHRCALELNALAREVELRVKEKGREVSEIRDLQTRYDEILSRYENHSDIDYRVAQIKKAPEFYGITWRHRARAFFDEALSLSPYFVIMAIGVIYIIVLLLQ